MPFSSTENSTNSPEPVDIFMRTAVSRYKGTQFSIMVPMRFSSWLALLLVGSAVVVQAQESGTSAPVVQTIRRGEAAMQHGDLVQAEAAFRSAVQMAPDLSDAYLGLGLVELREGKLEPSVSALEKATQLNPQLPGAHMFLGIAQYQMGRGAPAEEALKAEVALQPQNVEALTWLGVVELGMGQAEEAADALDKASALAPKDANVLYYKGRAHSQVAEAAYKQLYALDPDSVLVHRALGDTLAGSGQPDKAIAEYEAAIRKQPDNPDLYELLAEQDQKMSRDDAAATAYEQELKLNPHNAIALYNLGMMKVKRGDPAGGVVLLRKAVAEHAAAAPVDFYLGLGLAEMGQSAEAAQWLEKSLENSPSPFLEQSAYYQLVRVYQKLHRTSDEQRALEKLKELKEAAARKMTGGDGGVSGSVVAPSAGAAVNGGK